MSGARTGVRPAAAASATAAAAAALLLAGCGLADTADFYWQGAVGQADLIRRAKPLDQVVAATDDPVLKARLERVQSIRAFASRELGLPDNGTFTRYADIGRPFVVWNVFAAPPLALKARQWCFPVAGCVNYRGYFSEDDARAEAARLAREGDDVHVGGVPAYSTLGWLDDPVLSSFVRWRETDLARIMFHELAHQVVYVKDDTSFNESFAVAVEEAGLARWLDAQAGRPEHAQLVVAAARSDRLRADFRGLVTGTRAELQRLYAGDAPDDAKRAAKAAIFGRMRADYERLKAGWDGVPAFDRWFETGANNAGVVAVGLYTDRVPAFRALLAAEGGDLPRFYVRVKALAGLPRPERDAALGGPDLAPAAAATPGAAPAVAAGGEAR
jgi:predicted aminopeptidase